MKKTTTDMLLIAFPGTGFGCARFPIMTDRLDLKGQITGFRHHIDQPCPMAALPMPAPHSCPSEATLPLPEAVTSELNA